MPSNLAKEYETNFKKDLRSLNRLKGSLDSAIADPNSPKVAGDLAKAKKITDDYKVNQRTFNCLFKKYQAHLEQQEEGDDAEGDVRVSVAWAQLSSVCSDELRAPFHDLQDCS